jgi:hypothetical protein
MIVGQRVQWQSQGKGCITTKIGKIVRVVKQGEVPWKVGHKEFPNHTLMFNGWGLPGGKEIKVAYFVEVIISQGTKPRLYMPFPYKLMRY